MRDSQGFGSGRDQREYTFPTDAVSCNEKRRTDIPSNDAEIVHSTAREDARESTARETHTEVGCTYH